MSQIPLRRATAARHVFRLHAWLLVAAGLWVVAFGPAVPGARGGQTSDEKDAKAAAEWRAKAETGSAVAQYNLGICYLRGQGVPRDEVEAFRWQSKAAKAGLAVAAFSVARSCMWGRGVEKDEAEGNRMAFAAADAGEPGAMVLVGYSYLTGRGGLAKNEAEAFKWFQSAAALGYANAAYNLACCYRNGQGAAKNLAASVEWLRKGAAGGDESAQLLLGLCFSWGEGLPQNFVAAVYWWRKAAEAGNLTAQYSLAHALAEGKGVAKNEVEAARWYRRAAEGGDPGSQNNLGWAYQNGLGLPKDLIEAFAWTKLGADGGFKAAQAELPNFEHLLNPADMAEARKRSALYGRRIESLKAARAYSEPGFPTTLPTSSPEGDVVASEREAILSRADGTGYFVSLEGHVMTCAHVVDGATKFWVRQGNNAPQAARLVRVDSANDLALLVLVKKSTKLLEPLPLAAKNARTAESVFTIGFPNTTIQGLTPKVTDGRITSINGYEDDPASYQISVAVQPGNSGGPLINMKGEVVGVVQSMLSGRVMLRAGADIPQNVGYAVKISMAGGLLADVPLVRNLAPLPAQGADALPDLAERAMKAVVLVLAE